MQAVREDARGVIAGVLKVIGVSVVDSVIDVYVVVRIDFKVEGAYGVTGG